MASKTNELGINERPTPGHQPLGINPWSLRFTDLCMENTYCAELFRQAYPLHVSYTVSLICMFLVGIWEETFAVASITLAPGFLIILCIRVHLHQQEDTLWAQQFGTWFMSCGDSCIWLTSAAIFRSYDITGSVFVLGLYSISIVMYPIILMMRTHTHFQRMSIVAIAIASIAATPSWVQALTQMQFFILNASALVSGTVVAFFMERCEAKCCEMHARDACARCMREMHARDACARCMPRACLSHSTAPFHRTHRGGLERMDPRLSQVAPAGGAHAPSSGLERPGNREGGLAA